MTGRRRASKPKRAAPADVIAWILSLKNMLRDEEREATAARGLHQPDQPAKMKPQRGRKG